MLPWKCSPVEYCSISGMSSKSRDSGQNDAADWQDSVGEKWQSMINARSALYPSRRSVIEKLHLLRRKLDDLSRDHRTALGSRNNENLTIVAHFA